MAYLADVYALYLTHNNNFCPKTLYRDSRRLVEPEYVKKAISTNRYNVRIITSTATYIACYVFPFALRPNFNCACYLLHILAVLESPHPPVTVFACNYMYAYLWLLMVTCWSKARFSEGRTSLLRQKNVRIIVRLFSHHSAVNYFLSQASQNTACMRIHLNCRKNDLAS